MLSSGGEDDVNYAFLWLEGVFVSFGRTEILCIFRPSSHKSSSVLFRDWLLEFSGPGFGAKS